MFKNWPYENVFMDNHAYHSFNIADIASENPKEDRQRQYVHEKIACSYKSQLHFQTCNVVPVFVGEFSIAIDNCMPHLDARYADYGQCRDVASRLESPWWIQHIKSFAMRQIATAERELGWAFWTYKLDTQVEATEPSANFWSFRLAAKRGFIDKSFYGRKDACLYAPTSDWELGDEEATLSSKHHKNSSFSSPSSSYLRKNSSSSSNKKSKSKKEEVDLDLPQTEDDEGVIIVPPPAAAAVTTSEDDEVTGDDDANTNTWTLFSNYAFVTVMILFVGAVAMISHQRLRDVVTTVGGGYATIQDPERP
jgi:hypothetical protein